MGLSVLDNVLVPAYGGREGYEKARERAVIRNRIQDVFYAMYYVSMCLNYAQDEALKDKLREANYSLQQLYRELTERLSRLDGGEG